jgi:hypothetical protein
MQSLQVSNMANLYKTLTEIDAIRGQIARAAKFRAYGPATLAATGALALVFAAAQSYWLQSPAREIGLYLAIWLSTAAVSVIIIEIETIRGARRVHFWLAKEMIHSATEQFLPAIVAS